MTTDDTDDLLTLARLLAAKERESVDLLSTLHSERTQREHNRERERAALAAAEQRIAELTAERDAAVSLANIQNGCRDAAERECERLRAEVTEAEQRGRSEAAAAGATAAMVQVSRVVADRDALRARVAEERAKVIATADDCERIRGLLSKAIDEREAAEAKVAAMGAGSVDAAVLTYAWSQARLRNLNMTHTPEQWGAEMVKHIAHGRAEQAAEVERLKADRAPTCEAVAWSEPSVNGRSRAKMGTARLQATTDGLWSVSIDEGDDCGTLMAEQRAKDLASAKSAALAFALSLNGATLAKPAPATVEAFDFPAIEWQNDGYKDSDGATAADPLDNLSAWTRSDGVWHLGYEGVAATESIARATVERLHDLVTGSATARPSQTCPQCDAPEIHCAGCGTATTKAWTCAECVGARPVEADAARHLGNLLARIHRDGGQCVEAVGLDRAAQDAEAWVVARLDGPVEADPERARLVEAVVEAADRWTDDSDPNATRYETRADRLMRASIALRAHRAAPPPVATPTPEPGRPHIVDGEFQSDKYPTCPRGKVPLSVKDRTAQDLLWEYAQRHRSVDGSFADDLEFALTEAGFATHECRACDAGWATGRAQRPHVAGCPNVATPPPAPAKPAREGARYVAGLVDNMRRWTGRAGAWFDSIDNAREHVSRLNGGESREIVRWDLWNDRAPHHVAAIIDTAPAPAEQPKVASAVLTAERLAEAMKAAGMNHALADAMAPIIVKHLTASGPVALPAVDRAEELFMAFWREVGDAIKAPRAPYIEAMRRALASIAPGRAVTPDRIASEWNMAGDDNIDALRSILTRYIGAAITGGGS